MPIRVAIVEDQKRTREGLALLIDGSPRFSVHGCWGSIEEALPGLERELPDVLLMDIGLPGVSGIDGVEIIRQRWPRLPVVMLTVHGDDGHVFDAVCAGACGYFLKESPPATLLAGIQEVHEGGAPMSPEIARKVVLMFRQIAPRRNADHNLSTRELEVLQQLANGQSYKTCAENLSIGIDTVRFHIRRIYERLHVHSKSEAVTLALRKGIIR